MTPEKHRALRESLGGYALGHLSGQDAATVERHLARCADCRAELDDIAPLAAKMRSVDWRRLAETSGPDPEMTRRVVDSIRRESRQRTTRELTRRLSAAVAVAAAVVAFAGVGVVAGRSSAPGTPAAPKVPLEAVALRTTTPGLDASAGVVPHTWGVEIKLRAAGFTRGSPYAVYVTTATGQRRTAGAFVGTGEKTMNCNLNSDVLRPDAVAFAVVDAAGRTVLSATLPPVS